MSRIKITVSVLIVLFLIPAAYLFYQSYSNDLKNHSNVNPAVFNKTYKNPETDPAYKNNEIFYLQINGSKEFKRKIKQSLKLIWIYDRSTFNRIKEHIFEIRQSNRTCFTFDNGKSVIEISMEKYKYYSETFLASVIAHQFWHAYQLINKRKLKKKNLNVPPPDKNITDKSIPLPEVDTKKFNDLFKIENYAFRYQLKILKKIKAPQKEINLLERRKYNDFSLAHDGNYIIEF